MPYFQRHSLLIAVFGLALLAPGAAWAQYGYPAPYQAYGSRWPAARRWTARGCIWGSACLATKSSTKRTRLWISHRRGRYNLMLGFRLNPMFALELGLGQGFHNNVTDAWATRWITCP